MDSEIRIGFDRLLYVLDLQLRESLQKANG
jgi:hypothetical protein